MFSGLTRGDFKMAINSVNTNVSALVALVSMNKTTSDLQSVQKRVTTGNRVADAIDDGAAFAVSQQYRSDMGAYGAVNQQLSIARGTVSIGVQALKSVSDVMAKARETLVKLADENVNGDSRTQYNNDLAALASEIASYITSASINGVNLISAAATDLKVISNIDGTQFTVTSKDVETDTAAGLAPVADAAAAQAALTGAFATAVQTVNLASNTLAADYRRLQQQTDFNDALSKATEEALGAVVDADLAKESAALQALQVRQQLGTQTLSIANQAPQALLRLFQ